MSFLQCPRRLWLEVHRGDLAVQDPARLARFEAGHRVGAIARDLYAQAAIASGRSVEFETQYVHDEVLVRADVIERGGLFDPQAGATRLIEVKSSSGVSPGHVADCAIQTAVMQADGDPPRSVAVAHIDGKFTYPGRGDFRGLLKEVDVTDRVLSLAPSVPAWSADAQRVLADEEPPVPVGTQCFSPRPCPFVQNCWPPAEYPLTSLPNVREKLNQYVARGYQDLREVPESEVRGADALRVWRATRAGRPEVSSALREELRALPYPRYYLDFETIGACVPIWPGTSPNQPIPYQWSVHVERAPASEPEHFEYLDSTGNLPARSVAESLVRVLGTSGPILTYSSYERRCLRILAGFAPELAEQLVALESRLVDLLPIVKRGYYHPQMHGSWSIKAVLPTVAPELRYESLGDVREGLGAERAYLQAIDTGTSVTRREYARRALLTYCAFDTMALLRVVRALQG